MATKCGPPVRKRKNPADLTARNIKPRDRQIAALDDKIAAVEEAVKALTLRVGDIQSHLPEVAS